MEIQITLEQYKNDEYQDVLENMNLKEIIIRRHCIVILQYV